MSRQYNLSQAGGKLSTIFTQRAFAPAMATGIVAIACNLEGLGLLAHGLADIDIAIFVMVTAMTVLRGVLFPRAFYRDIGDHNRGVGFFTTVAGAAVLGSCAFAVFGLYRLPLLLWFASLILLALATYSIFAAFILKRDKPSLREGIHACWLLAVGATP